MRDIALQVARESKRGERNVLREYLQNYILLLMQKTKMNESLYFVGGTALRFLYGIRRYSEDLDFTAGKGWMKFNLKLFSSRIGQELERAGYDVTIISKDQKTVQRIMIRFAGLLDALGLAGGKEQKFSVHLEIDINPPSGWKEERTIVNIHHPVLIRHYDLPSAFAGKLAAVLLRPYSKGRDIFDLFWFRSRWPSLGPNLVLLNNALKQQGLRFKPLREDTWISTVRRKIKALDWKSVKDDVIPFLESEDDLTAFSRDALLTLYASHDS
jgi:predicted nucleotidyltransferase component of viral defense system